MFSVNLERASAAFFDFPSVIIPIPTPRTIAPIIPTESVNSPISALINAAAINISIIGSLNASFKSCKKPPSSLTVNSFFPYFSFLLATSSFDTPLEISTSNSLATSSELLL